ncbi:hypothetical protein JTE90_021402 [Oedothorax gibbosus]|uniref:Uncharacterized protein n=1 Tax=Oedothorax gibbosus TaxID=931172 RepID=A0AAV6VGU9_9ARAC|nr:hypothetical protein JTE90_021402 [Oedothorax gibbosus]
MKPALLFCFWVVSTTNLSISRAIPATLEVEAGTSQAAVETTLSPEDQAYGEERNKYFAELARQDAEIEAARRGGRRGETGVGRL